MLRFAKDVLEEMVAHCLHSYPLEACGLVSGIPDTEGGAVGLRAYPLDNEAASARVYTVEARGMLRAERDAESRGEEILGVYHSHTHTEAMPSPTDIDQAPDPGWHYVLVSLRDVSPSVRSWKIEGGKIREEPVVLQW